MHRLLTSSAPVQKALPSHATSHSRIRDKVLAQLATDRYAEAPNVTMCSLSSPQDAAAVRSFQRLDARTCVEY